MKNGSRWRTKRYAISISFAGVPKGISKPSPSLISRPAGMRFCPFPRPRSITIQNWDPAGSPHKTPAIEMYQRAGLLCLSLMWLVSCKEKKKDTLFSLLTPDRSGIHFRNDITEDDSSSSFIDEFGYMGGGVGIGDFNNDGLKDILFTGNQTSCRLYINKGGNIFEDITA